MWHRSKEPLLSSWPITIEELPADHRISGLRLDAVLGAWPRPGPAYVALADAAGRDPFRSRPLSTRLPSERDLADAAGMSRTTTTATYGLLRDEGCLVSRRGSGTVTTLPSGPGARVSMAESVGHEPGVVDLAMAAPSAPSSLHGAYLAALDALPRHLSGKGYSPLGLPVLREAVARWYTRAQHPNEPGPDADHDRRAAGDPPAGHRARRTRRPRGRRAPHLPARDRRGPERRCPPVPVSVRRSGLDIDLLESTLRQMSPRLVYFDPRPPQPDRDQPRRRGARPGACPGPAVSHDDRRRRGADRADHERAGAPLVRSNGTASAYVVSIGSASRGLRGGLRVGWVRAHPDLVARLARIVPIPTTGQRCWSSWSWPSCSRNPDLLERRQRSCAPGATCWSAGCSTSFPPGISTCLRPGSRSRRTSAHPCPARSPRPRPGTASGWSPAQRSGSTEASSGTCGCRSPRPPTTYAEPSPGWPTASAGLGITAPVTGPDAGARAGLRSDQRQRRGSASPGRPRAAGRTACTPCAAERAPVLAEPLLGVVLRGEHRADRRSRTDPSAPSKRHSHCGRATITRPPCAAPDSARPRRPRRGRSATHRPDPRRSVRCSPARGWRRRPRTRGRRRRS